MKSNALLPLLAFTVLVPGNPAWAAEPPFTPPASPRATYSFNSGWKFIRQDVPGAQEVSFDDSLWETVSTPHSFNDVDSFRVIIDHSGGDRGTYKGLNWYRKHFKLPAEAAGSKVFVEFEGMRQAGDIYFNGKPFGLYEDGIRDRSPSRGLGDVYKRQLLPVSAPFHCSLMQPAADVMARALAEVTIRQPASPLVSNVLAAPITDPDEIRRRLIEQVTGTVRWRESVAYMASRGVTRFFEIGAGKVLSGLVKRIAEGAVGISVSGPNDLNAAKDALAAAQTA